MKKKIKIQYSLILSYLAIILIPLIALGSIAFYISQSIVLEQTVEKDQAYIQQVSNNVDTVVSHMRSTSLIAYSSTLLQQYIRNENVGSMEIIGDVNINNYLYSLKSADYENYTYILKTYNSDIIYCNNYDYEVKQDYDFEQLYWIDAIKDNDESAIFIPTYTPEYYDQDETPVFSIARQISDNYTLVPLGYIIINCDASKLDEIIPNTNDLLFIFDEYDRQVYPYTDNDSLNINVEAIIESKESTQTINKEKYLVSKLDSPSSKLQYIKVSPYKDIRKNSNLIIQLTLITILFSILLSLLFSYLLSKRISVPINDLIQNMNNINKEENSAIEINTDIREIDELNVRFNKMMNRINDYVQYEYMETINRKDIEFKLLQSQISPHFLFNSLESIRMMAALNDDEEAATMIYNLANLYRYSIRITDSLVPLSNEIDHIYHYIQLQKMRFGEKFDYSQDVNESALDAVVPQLILQPLIENTITHGFRGIDYKGLINLRITRTENQLSINIIDNGVGINPVKLYEIKRQLGTTRSNGHIGLLATFERIKYHFTDSEVLIESSEGHGTTITINITYT